MDVEEKGVVVEERGKLALVRAAESSSCAGCASAGICHGGGAERTVEAENIVGARRGDKVVMTLPSGALLRASFQVYILPVIGLLAGAGITQVVVGRLAGQEAAGMAAGIGGLVGAAMTVVLLRVAGGKRSARSALRPRIVRLD